MKIHASPLLSAVLAALVLPGAAWAGIKYWDNQAYKAYDVDCYVPGAVWNYDGIRNAGADQPHSTTATTWKNIGTGSSSEPEVYLQKYNGGSSWSAATAGELSAGTYGEWTDKGFVLKGNARLRRDSPGRIDTGTKYSIQFLVDANANNQGEMSNATVFNSNWDSLTFAINVASGRLRWKTKMSFNNSDNAPFISGPSFDYVTAIANEDDGTTVLFSGTEAPTSGDGYREYSSISGHSEAGYAFGSTPNGAALFTGTLYSFRYYQRVLSNEDVAWNRVVDEARYFNRVAPLPVTNAVVVSSVAASTEPAGTYAVDSRHVFTAPRVATVDDNKYVCTGYTLETWDGEAGNWGAAVFHARELSCKVEEADCVRITWQWMDGEGLVTYDVSDYVWDGLEVFYDGICNQGTNVAHSMTATTWVNLGSVGSDNDVFVQRLNAAGTGWETAADLNPVGERDPGYWTDNGFRLEAESRLRCNAPGGFTVGTNYSLQMLVDVKASDQVNAYYAYLFGAQADQFALRLHPTNGKLFFRYESGVADSPYLSGGTYDYVTAIMRDTNKQAIFSGTTEPTSGNGYRADTACGYSDTGFAFGGYSKTGTDNRFVGTIKSFRQYDHALSAEEVAQNRKVDDFRYFGTFAEADVIVQSTHSALRGNEPDGEYDVDGSHVFTAPASMTIMVNGKEIEYACDGYTVERGKWKTRASTTFFVCTNAQTFATTSYAYDEADGLVRLTWLWKPVRGLRTAADYSFDDYSRAGLVWHYDGIYNAGVGVHDSSAATWKNLGERANSDLHWNGATSTGHWTDDGYVFAGGPRFKGNAAFLLRNCTMQTLIDGNPADQIVTQPYCFNGSGNYFNFRVIRGDYNGSASNSFCWVAQNNMYMYFHAPGNRYSFATGIQDFDNKKAMMFPDTTIPTEYTKDGTYGAQRLYHEFASMNEVDDDGYGLGNVNAGNAGFVGTVKNFRYYDRVLTEEELSRNRNVDAVRYFGALGVTNLVVEVEEGSGITADPAPGAYFVEGSYEFSSSRPGNAAYGCYRLQDWNGSNWVNPRTVGGTTFTFNVSGATAPKMRLTWCDRKPFVLVVR